MADNVILSADSLSCDTQGIHLTVTWGAVQPPDHDLSVFVHLIGGDPTNVLASGDVNAPVDGWYPTTRWTANEAVKDVYTVPYKPDATGVQFGMYDQPTPGHFANYGVTTLPLPDSCRATAS